MESREKREFRMIRYFKEWMMNRLINSKQIREWTDRVDNLINWLIGQINLSDFSWWFQFNKRIYLAGLQLGNISDSVS